MMKSHFFYIVCFLWSLTTFSQTYNFTQYGEEQGLNQSYIYSISQSQQGSLVFSGGEAICMFDGNNFTSVYDKNMKENLVTTHFIDSRHVIWMGHQQSGVSYINFKHPNALNDSILNGVKVTQFTEDKKHQVWLAGSNGLYRVDTNFKVSKLKLPDEKSYYSIIFNKQQQLLAGSSDGLFIINSTGDKAGSIKLADDFKDKFVKQIIAADATGLSYWVLADDVIYGIKSIHGTYKIISQIKNEQGTSGSGITCIYKDRYNNLWISKFGEGLKKLSFRGNPVEGLYAVTTINKSNGLKSQNIQSIFQDAEGNMWFGTYGEGLIKKPLEMFSFFGLNEGLQITDVKQVISEHGNLWMATDEGLAVLNREKHQYKIYNRDNGFVNDKVTALFLNGDKLLIGTATRGVYELDIPSNKFSNFSERHKLKPSTINCITKAGNTIMIGTTDGLCVCGNDPLSTEQLSTNDGLFHNNIKYLFEDSKKRVWICSHGAPPYYIISQKITSFKKVKGLNSYNLTSACEDNNGNIWIATDGDGIFRYNNKEFFNYTTQQGLLSNYCNGIETDKNNSVWITHRSGLSELKESTQQFSTYTNRKGLLFAENNSNAIYKDSTANLWFGTTQGVVAYNIESGKALPELPEIFITDLQLNRQHFSNNEVIEKKYGYYSVHIDYKAISLTDPSAIYYKYRLTDVDTLWKITNMSYIDFPKLGDGEYTFEVMACNSNKGLCSVKPAKISFIIQKPVWKHFWFYLIVSCLIIFISYLVVTYRTRSLRKTQLFLELKVEQKTYLLKREKDAVESIKTDLERKNKDITDSIHYAKHIQDSLLPPDELMNDLFNNNSFVLYQPKDIVSGDFYWCSEGLAVNDDKLCLAAVIDCTGHGVPGAFLSILANDFLKQSLAELKTHAPDKILNYLNSSISSHFNQHSAKSKIRDGMDIALIAINYKEQKLYYAGANNPIYILRKKQKGIEEIIIKATKQAIGSANEVIRDYHMHTVDVIEGDMIYLFSDGYADQFGGEKNKKLTYKAFRSIIKQSFTLPVQQQKIFLETKIEAWKSTHDQTDDICVMGIRI